MAYYLLKATIMPPWLLIWIARWASGERLRKATSEDYRLHFGVFFLTGVFMFFVTLGEPILNRASALLIFILTAVSVVVLFFGAFAWARLVPAAISLLLAILTWGGFVWFALWKTHVL